MGIHGDMTIGIALQPVWQANLAANVKPLPKGGPHRHLHRAIPLLRGSRRLRRHPAPGLLLHPLEIGTPAQSGLVGYLARHLQHQRTLTFGAPVIFNPVLAIPFIIITS